MTEPRAWPNNEKETRDGAAERVNEASVLLDQVVVNGLLLHYPIELLLSMYQIQHYLLDTLRLLEKSGAQTRPQEMGRLKR